jgi:hypothetical protein
VTGRHSNQLNYQSVALFLKRGKDNRHSVSEQQIFCKNFLQKYAVEAGYNDQNPLLPRIPLHSHPARRKQNLYQRNEIKYHYGNDLHGF